MVTVNATASRKKREAQEPHQHGLGFFLEVSLYRSLFRTCKTGFGFQGVLSAFECQYRTGEPGASFGRQSDFLQRLIQNGYTVRCTPSALQNAHQTSPMSHGMADNVSNSAAASLRGPRRWGLSRSALSRHA